MEGEEEMCVVITTHRCGRHIRKDTEKLHRSHTYVFEGFSQLCELVEALLHDVGRPLVYLVVLVRHSAQHTLHRLGGWVGGWVGGGLRRGHESTLTSVSISKCPMTCS